MSSVIVCSGPHDGHVSPMLGVARRLIDRGHRVRFLTGPAYEDAVKDIGAEFLPLGPGAEYATESSAATGVQAIREGIRGLVIEPARGQYLPLAAAVAAEPTDAVLAEVTFVGAATLSRLPRSKRPPIITCGILPLTLSSRDCAPYGSGLAPGKGPGARLRNQAMNWLVSNVVLKDSQRQVDALTRELVGAGLDGLFILDWARRTELIAQFTVQEFEYPRSDAPGNLRFFGPMSRHAASASVTPKPEWWGELDGSRPVVYVTQGTVSNEDFTALVGPTLEGLAGEDVTVVVSTGRRPLDALPPLPANARAAEFLPDAELLPKVDVYVTNGGYGGLHYAMENGVPIVVAGDTEDKPEGAARVAWAGVGINLKTGRPKPEAIRDAVRKVLGDGRYRAGSQRIGAAIAASPGVDGLIDEMEAMLRKV
ncbi:glycosyltransferase [Arthrobacter sp. AFG20]|uniref:glycosyltransferase n=1 Tax=Arthrobacter sp. AFG20 TaxID=1688671 RepID=UPI000C9DB864|nr:nucleotide disphospho-sugar-binding domain-containing protein [Arthrobacter sp. AFG20]PNH85157.1 glycosyl transferase [Arthrobacter sp. AFG20]